MEDRSRDQRRLLSTPTALEDFRQGAPKLDSTSDATRRADKAFGPAPAFHNNLALGRRPIFLLDSAFEIENLVVFLPMCM
jgi:hypothetical protein